MQKFNKIFYIFIAISILIAIIFTAYAGAKYEGKVAINISLFFILLPFLYESKFKKRDPLEYYGITREKITFSIKHLPFIILALSLIILVTVLEALGVSGEKMPLPFFEERIGRGLLARMPVWGSIIFIVSWVIGVMTGAFAEELLFRGLIQKKLTDARVFSPINPTFAIVLQALFFGIIHCKEGLIVKAENTGWIVSIFTFTTSFGLIAGYLTHKYKSIVPAWIIHSIFNWRDILFTGFGF